MNLFFSVKGGELPTEEERAEAQDKLDRMMDFDEWCAIKPRTDEEKAAYHLIKRDLQLTAAGEASDVDIIALAEYYTAPRH